MCFYCLQEGFLNLYPFSKDPSSSNVRYFPYLFMDNIREQDFDSAENGIWKKNKVSVT